MTEDPLKSLVDLVDAHYAASENPTPLLLSRIGATNKDLLAALKEKYGTLSAAVKAAGERLRIVDPRPGRQSVAPANIATAIERKIEQETASQKTSSSNFDSLPKAIQIAFCVRTEVGEIVTVGVAWPFAYQIIPSLELLRPGYRHLPDEYRKPGLLLKEATLHDREALWRSFIAWTEKERLDPASFKSTSRTNALSRLLAAQPADIMNRLVIPADIATLLLRQP